MTGTAQGNTTSAKREKVGREFAKRLAVRWSESLFAQDQYEADSRIIVLVLREYFLRFNDFFSSTYSDTTYGLVKGENVEQV